MDKYEEVLSRAKQQLCSSTDAVIRELIEFIFPELKESEDEKIRKALILNVSADKTNGYNMFWKSQGVEIDSVLEWLKKQGKGTEDEKKKKVSQNLK